MESDLRDLLTRLTAVLSNPETDTNADDLIEVFGEVEANRDAISRQLTAWLESDSD